MEEIEFHIYPFRIGDFYMLILKFSIKVQLKLVLLFVMIKQEKIKNVVTFTNLIQMFWIMSVIMTLISQELSLPVKNDTIYDIYQKIDK